jgi:hypothetical protein
MHCKFLLTIPPSMPCMQCHCEVIQIQHAILCWNVFALYSQVSPCWRDQINTSREWGKCAQTAWLGIRGCC